MQIACQCALSGLAVALADMLRTFDESASTALRERIAWSWPRSHSRNVTKRWGTSSASTSSTWTSPTRSSWCSSALGLRQDHDHADDRRARRSDRGRDLDRRPGGQQARAQGPRHLDGVPELRALPQPDRLREHPLSAEGAQGADATAPRARDAPRRSMVELGDSARPPPARPSRAASASASRWPAPSCASPTSS